MEIPQRHGKRANPNTVFSLVQLCELAFYVKSFAVAYVLISRFFFFFYGIYRENNTKSKSKVLLYLSDLFRNFRLVIMEQIQYLM